MLSLPVTVALLLAFAGAAGVCGWRGARTPDLRRGPRLIPWRPLMAGFAVAALLMLVHLVNLLGVQTGQR